MGGRLAPSVMTPEQKGRAAGRGRWLRSSASALAMQLRRRGGDEATPQARPRSDSERAAFKRRWRRRRQQRGV